jgi:hypothetical protein
LAECVAIQKDTDDQDILFSINRLGRVARLENDYEHARQYYIDGLRLAHQYNSRQSLAWCLAEFAELAAINNQSEKATCLLGVAEAIPELYSNLFPHERLELEQISGTIRNSLDDESFKTAYETGRQMSADEIITYALEETDQ